MQIVSNFELSAKKFLDNRQSWTSLDELKANTNVLMPNGFLAYCKNENKWYKMNCTDESNPTTYTWSEFNNLGNVDELNSEKVKYSNDLLSDVTNVKQALDSILAKLYYVKPSINSFTASTNGGVFEVGTTITAPITFNWEYNKNITTQSLTNCTLTDETVRTVTYDSDITTDKTFILTASDGENTVSKSIGYKFVTPYYVGVSTTDVLTETEITALTKKVETKGSKTVDYTTSQSYMVFAYPKSYGAISSVVDKNGFNVTDSFTQSTITVGTVEYYVYISNQCTGIYTMKFNY